MTPADLDRCRLYGILDLSYIEKSEMERVAGQMILGGVDLIQLRAKTHAAAEIAEVGAVLHDITESHGVPLVINDHPEIAGIARAEGVHVGQEDIPIAKVREIAGPNCIVGKSTHSVEQAIRASNEGADYIGFGPLFTTPTKPDYVPIGLEEIRTVYETVRVPIFCIGGITLENLPAVIAAGGRRVVIVSGLLQAEDIALYARTAKELLSKAGRFQSRPPRHSSDTGGLETSAFQ